MDLQQVVFGQLHLQWLGRCSSSSQVSVLGSLLCGTDEMLYAKVGKARWAGACFGNNRPLLSVDWYHQYRFVPFDGGHPVDSRLNCGSGLSASTDLTLTGWRWDTPREQCSDHADWTAWMYQDPQREAPCLWGLEPSFRTQAWGAGSHHHKPHGWQPWTPPGQHASDCPHQQLVRLDGAAGASTGVGRISPDGDDQGSDQEGGAGLVGSQDVGCFWWWSRQPGWGCGQQGHWCVSGGEYEGGEPDACGRVVWSQRWRGRRWKLVLGDGSMGWTRRFQRVGVDATPLRQPVRIEWGWRSWQLLVAEPCLIQWGFPIILCSQQYWGDWWKDPFDHGSA